MRAVVLELVWQLFLGKFNALWLEQRCARLAVEQRSVAGLTGMARDLRPVVLGGNGNLHGEGLASGGF
jgi:hypothetical protein